MDAIRYMLGIFTSGMERMTSGRRKRVRIRSGRGWTVLVGKGLIVPEAAGEHMAAHTQNAGCMTEESEAEKFAGKRGTGRIPLRAHMASECMLMGSGHTGVGTGINRVRR